MIRGTSPWEIKMAYTTDEVFKKYTDEETFSKIVNYDSVSQMWKHCVEAYADLKAVDFNGKEYTYAQLEEDAASFRANFRNIEKGKRIALFSANSYDFVKVYLAIVTSGLSCVILPAQLDEMSVFGCCMKFGVQMLVVSPELEEKAKIAVAKGVKVIKTTDMPAEKLPAADVSPDAEAVLMFTGGTSGKSKAAVLCNRAVMQGTVNGCYGFHDVFEQKYLLVLPLSHVFGLIRNLMTSLYTGSEIRICMNNKDMFKDIAMFRPTILVAVPALVEMALGLSRQFGKNMLGEDMKYVICGAAMVPPYLIAEWAKYGTTVLAGYGLTESANLVSGNPDSATNPSSVGYLYPNQEVKIVDGELWLKGKNMLTEYAGDPEENQAAFEDGWFKTGDLVRLDEKGYLYIIGRTKEVIVLPTGENISPAEVESYFNKLNLIQDSQVFEDIDEGGKHILALEVVPRAAEMAKVQEENKGAVLVGELNKINDTLPTYMRVSKITVRTSDFERTPSMKIKRYKKC